MNQTQKITPFEDRLFTIEEAADYLHVSATWLWKRRREGRLAGLKASRNKVLFRKSALDHLLIPENIKL
ncbi:MAG TPA: helix-turn-helix domain-containing protein [Chitinophagaceae bacterium]|nr:helix-turn-helix domain-containing protein [Chitinophagaceae bacterium]